MDVTPLINADTPIIQSYKSGIFKVSGQIYDHNIMVGMNGVNSWDGSFESLPPHDVLIVGTGKIQVCPDAKTRAQTPMEAMSTDAACRTYNALISDGRHVLVCLQRYL